MNLKEVIKAEKTQIDTGKWASGHVPRSSFPLSKVKDKSYKLGPAYQWRVVKFICLKRNCRVLITLNEEKGIFRARLGVEDKSDLVVLCDYEFHMAEPGWHCHFTLDRVESVTPGAARDGKRKRPRRESPTDRFPATKANALFLAARRYGFEIIGGLI